MNWTLLLFGATKTSTSSFVFSSNELPCSIELNPSSCCFDVRYMRDRRVRMKERKKIKFSKVENSFFFCSCCCLSYAFSCLNVFISAQLLPSTRAVTSTSSARKLCRKPSVATTVASVDSKKQRLFATTSPSSVLVSYCNRYFFLSSLLCLLFWHISRETWVITYIPFFVPFSQLSRRRSIHHRRKSTPPCTWSSSSWLWCSSSFASCCDCSASEYDICFAISASLPWVMRQPQDSTLTSSPTTTTTSSSVESQLNIKLDAQITGGNDALSCEWGKPQTN